MGQYQPKSVWLFVHSMLIALTPVILLPVSHFIFKEKVGWQAILGTLLAIAGVAILFLA
jgi:drug/metabolite transporter (DMT)-like permease